MTKFYRKGHERTNAYGYTFPVTGHYVNRDDFSQSQPVVWAQPLSRHIFSSYTNPNAKCPICGESVFFYRSPFGGAVFFDELGPPWPKHPCTISNDERQTVRSTKYSVTPSGEIYGTENHSPREYNWYINGWEPLIHPRILSVTTTCYKVSGYIDKISGSMEKTLVTYFFYAYPDFLDLLSTPEKPLIQTIVINEQIANISFCWPSLEKSYDIVAYLKCESIPTFDRSLPVPKVKSFPLREQIQTVAATAPDTIMKKAMLEAVAKSTS